MWTNSFTYTRKNHWLFFKKGFFSLTPVNVFHYNHSCTQKVIHRVQSFVEKHHLRRKHSSPMPSDLIFSAQQLRVFLSFVEVPDQDLKLWQHYFVQVVWCEADGLTSTFMHMTNGKECHFYGLIIFQATINWIYARNVSFFVFPSTVINLKINWWWQQSRDCTGWNELIKIFYNKVENQLMLFHHDEQVQATLTQLLKNRFKTYFLGAAYVLLKKDANDQKWTSNELVHCNTETEVSGQLSNKIGRERPIPCIL